MNVLKSPRLERLEKILAVIKPLEGRKTYKAYANALEKAGIRAWYYDSMVGNKAFTVDVDGNHNSRETFYIDRPEELVPQVESYADAERRYLTEQSNPAYHLDTIIRYIDSRVLRQFASDTKETESDIVREAREKALEAVLKALREIRVGGE